MSQLHKSDFKSLKELTDKWNYRQQEQYIEHLNQMHQIRLSYNGSKCICQNNKICNSESGCFTCSIWQNRMMVK